jgi:lysophospholipase L1-like esterase
MLPKNGSYRWLLRAVAVSTLVVAAACTTTGRRGGTEAVRTEGRENPPPTVIAPVDPRLLYEGRIDFTDAAGPILIWEGTRVRLDFEGAQLVVRLDGLSEQNCFDVEVDGGRVVFEVPVGTNQQLAHPGPLGPGRHHLVLFKRTEASAGTARFRGVELARGAQTWAPPPPPYRLRMEFFGDSITAGACNEDGAADQWDRRRTHNNALSYGAMTAAAWSANYRCTAVSGMGVVAGWTDVKAGEVWDRLYPRAGAPRADLAAWQPDVAFVNFGENDGSFCGAHHQPFPADFAAGYEELGRAIRAAYPRAHLVLLRGGMFNGSQNADLRRAWETAVARLEAADPAVSHYVFTHWSMNHPRVADDRAMADELLAWLREQPFMRQYL